MDEPAIEPKMTPSDGCYDTSLEALMVRELTLQGLGTFQILMVRGLCQARRFASGKRLGLSVVGVVGSHW